ncbi:hypothetical protein CEXT_31171 [Caerostris extrusa]|uniref:Uncharacterized protein n=1 Tax=Caerostris extrusa TaxID=172846 RepID=A0AAV4XKQ5_CAEEX|nr:hypothetical protein CEXT_31171 [Caerostris extrusa]
MQSPQFVSPHAKTIHAFTSLEPLVFEHHPHTQAPQAKLHNKRRLPGKNRRSPLFCHCMQKGKQKPKKHRRKFLFSSELATHPLIRPPTTSMSTHPALYHYHLRNTRNFLLLQVEPAIFF